ncbi:TPA: tail fiber assembly protein [Salmonella enterica]|nr:tail fiber assembly protein [Salmonella enterica]EIG0992384.1 tail fiber assembly protein [Salmonella enterica]MDJ4622880.1 tail fiber assembly protein [Salmonella enterica]MDJ8004444.1 tail fiber assembly protein [Salmonella enterica]
MMILFSASNIGFYDEVLKFSYEQAGNWPDDLVEVTASIHIEYSGPAPEGKILGVDCDGMPAWVDIPAPTHDELVSRAESEKLRLKTVADTEIEWRQDAVDAEIATADESVALIAWRKYRVLLMRVDTSKPVWPALPGEQFS